MFETSVDGFGGAIGGVGVVEVGQDVPGSAFECPAQPDELGQTPRYTRGGQGVDFGLHQGLTHVRVGRPVGVDNVLVDAPGDLERDVLLTGEQVEDPVLLTWREQARAGVQHPAGLVQGIRGTPAPVVEFLPGAPSALIESITGKVYDGKGSMTALASGSSSAAALLNPVNPSIATISMRSRHVSGREASQVLKTCLERPGIMSKSRERPLRSRMGVKSKMTVTNLSP